MTQDLLGDHCPMCGARSVLAATECAACGESLIQFHEETDERLPTVPLFTGRQVAVVTFLFGLPAGLSLLTANGLRLGELDRVWFGWLVGGPFWLISMVCLYMTIEDPLQAILLVTVTHILFACVLYRRWYLKRVQARMDAGLCSAPFMQALLYGGAMYVVVMVSYMALRMTAG